MATFANYVFYKEHGGQLSEADYGAVVDEACAEILSQTNGAAMTAPEVMRDAVKLCECALVDVIAAYRESAVQLPRGVATITNDKFSISASSGEAAAARSEAEERRAVCARYLQWPHNLMCRWL